MSHIFEMVSLDFLDTYQNIYRWNVTVFWDLLQSKLERRAIGRQVDRWSGHELVIVH